MKIFILNNTIQSFLNHPNVQMFSILYGTLAFQQLHENLKITLIRGQSAILLFAWLQFSRHPSNDDLQTVATKDFQAIVPKVG